jgi:hypothetical protein
MARTWTSTELLDRMEFRNHSPFPAAAFGGVDQFEQRFRVVVLRQTFVWTPTGELLPADAQTPLCEVDEFFDSTAGGSPRYESDYCPFKPRCDILLNGIAHPPLRGVTTGPVFEIRLVVERPDRPAPEPSRPEALNPTMAPSREAIERWRSEVEHARAHPIRGERLVDKRLQVHGARRFQREGTNRATGMSWSMATVSMAEAVPLRLDEAFGGECRVEPTDGWAERVPHPQRLSDTQRRSHPDSDYPPIAHEALAANPWGKGFSTTWFLEVTAATQVAAPRIEYLDRPISAALFNDLVAGRIDPASVGIATFGVRPKGSPERAKLAGTIDDAFVSSDAPLPQDHDFAVWQSAWPDQQIDQLMGDEIIELTNLLPAGEPGESVEPSGNRVFRMRMPTHLASLTIRLATGEVFLVPMRIDTLSIDTDQRNVVCVWRAVLGESDDAEIRAAEVTVMNAATKSRFGRELNSYRGLLRALPAAFGRTGKGDIDG